MREFTKSAVSAGLAGSLFGIRQITTSLSESRPGEPHKATDAFNSVAQAMADQSGDSLRETFHAADKMQREIVDLTFGFLTFERSQSDTPQGSWTGMATQAAEQMGQWISNMTSSANCGCDSSDSGWGPVPPPDTQ